MFDLPIDAGINGCWVYHEGNHDDRGTPHNQYRIKIPQYHFATLDTNVNKYVKIATINYTLNANITLHYEFKIKEIFQGIDDHFLEVYLQSNTANTILKHIGSNKLTFYGIQTITGSNYNLDIYALSTVSYADYFIQVEFARTLMRADLGYYDEYANRHLTLWNNQTFLDSITPNVNEVVDRPPVSMRVNSVLNTVTANTTYKLYLTINGLTNDCIVSATSNIEIPSEFTYNIENSSINTLLIRIRNTANYSKDFPAVTWNIVYRKLI